MCNRIGSPHSLTPQIQGLSSLFPLLHLLACETSPNPLLTGSPLQAWFRVWFCEVSGTEAWGCDRTYPADATRTIRHRHAAPRRPPGAAAPAAREPARGQGLASGQRPSAALGPGLAPPAGRPSLPAARLNSDPAALPPPRLHGRREGWWWPGPLGLPPAPHPCRAAPPALRPAPLRCPRRAGPAAAARLHVERRGE